MGLKLGFLVIFTIPTVWSLNCDKTFTYYEEYNQNSFNVTCKGITKGYEHILENITINNEISLSIINSTLDNVTPSIFKNVKNIRILNLIDCVFNFDRNQAIFDKLHKLQRLRVQNTALEIENATFRGLAALKRLELRNNSVSIIEEGTFKETPNIERLDIVDNQVESIEDLSLCELKKLKFLNLEHNNIRNLKTFNFFCWKNSSIGVHINNQPTRAPSIHFNVASISYELVELDLGHNQILDLGYSFENLEKLRTLNIGFNRLNNLKYINLKWLFRLQKLNLTNNQLKIFDNRVFFNKSQLTEVDLSFNELNNFEASNVPQLQLLDLSFNNLSGLSLKNLTALNRLNIRCNQLTGFVVDVPNLLELNLAGNRFNITEQTFKNLFTLRFVSLQNNSISYIPDKTFHGLRMLKHLDLSSNNIQKLTPETFHDLDNLETLKLSDNSLKTLNYLTVEPLSNLRNLDVAANKLIYIEYDVILSKLPNLNNINIKSNQLACEDLEKIIAFLKQRKIDYTSNEERHPENLNENVAGIPCHSVVAKLEGKLMATGHGALFNLGILVMVVLALVVTGIISYRFHIYLKRRRYRADEFELVDE
ncbi:hypothetical protein ABEB36_000427 [Hypothenemus hampei]|uniref:Uncharacterized protein n=1 Tax=Hypothenemus hampei TaxID=57062 RepID=A0ABD1FB94_HYPHA